MTVGLKQASSTKLRLYKNMLNSNSTDNDFNKYKAFRNKYNRLKHHDVLTYYHEKCYAYKNNVKSCGNSLIRCVTKHPIKPIS